MEDDESEQVLHFMCQEYYKQEDFMNAFEHANKCEERPEIFPNIVSKLKFKRSRITPRKCGKAKSKTG